MTEEAKVQNWWQTVPGTLTAIAAVITAMAGFLAVLAQTGIIGRTEAPKNATQRPLIRQQLAPVLVRLAETASLTDQNTDLNILSGSGKITR
ncbi:MAG TPA: hypothetical protein VFE60_03055 [Roseiarcus sp.]|jgi:hypothetical protein|nr:hypothetical protein [Roseiarcus sp.]